MKLKELRNSLKKNQTEVANYLKITQEKYSRIENEISTPDIETLKRLADYFDVSLDFLCDRPRPYDLPSIATKNQKEAISIILQLNETNTLRVISYCAGLLANQI